ncbi:MAG: hypothetical protein H0T62_01830 [Parachlamydiaceae bacterium]|nr:hypothetical protein [Parachlamydiaceae bacterium]
MAIQDVVANETLHTQQIENGLESLHNLKQKLPLGEGSDQSSLLDPDFEAFYH